MSKKNGSINFGELRRLREEVGSGAVQIIRPDQADDQRAQMYLSEMREFWRKRGDWAKHLSGCAAHAGEPLPSPEETMKLAEEYATAEWRKQLSDVLEVLEACGRPVPEQIAFCARLCGLEVKAKETSAKSLVPAS